MIVYVQQRVERRGEKLYFVPMTKELDRLKERVAEGQVIHSWFSNEEKRSQPASNLFHQLRDRYAETLGRDRRAAKWELKYLCSPEGCVQEYQDTATVPPENFEVVKKSWVWSGEPGWMYLKSESAMSEQEHHTLIEQTWLVLDAAGADTADIG